jgi:ribokinase
LSKGVKNLILTLGSRGAYIVAGHAAQAEWVPAYPVQAVDTTAAGDCFIGALAVALSEGKSLRAATGFASAAAALSVTRMGAQPSMPARNEVDGFIQERSEK